MKQTRLNPLIYKQIKITDLLIYLLSLFNPMYKLHQITPLMIIPN